MTSAQLSIEHAKFIERLSAIRIELDAAHDILQGIKDVQSAIQQQNALQQQFHDDHRKRLDLWDARLWWFFTAVIVGLFAIITGLIVALVKR